MASIAKQKATVTVSNGRRNYRKDMKMVTPLQSEPNVIEPGNRWPHAGTWPDGKPGPTTGSACLQAEKVALPVVNAAMWCVVLIVLITVTGILGLFVYVARPILTSIDTSLSGEERWGSPPFPQTAESAGQRSPANSLGRALGNATHSGCSQHAVHGSPTVVGSRCS